MGRNLELTLRSRAARVFFASLSCFGVTLRAAKKSPVIRSTLRYTLGLIILTCCFIDTFF